MGTPTVIIPPTPPPYSLTPFQPGRWINPNGTPTTEFFRFIVNLFQSAGSGQAGTNLATLTALVTTLQNDETATEAALSALTDYVMTTREVDLSNIQNAIMELFAYVMTTRGLNSTVSALQRQVSDLQALVLTAR